MSDEQLPPGEGAPDEESRRAPGSGGPSGPPTPPGPPGQPDPYAAPGPYGPTSGQYGQTYGQPPVPGQGVQETNKLALSSMVVGLVALVPCCWGVPVLAVVALVLGFLGRGQITQSQGRQQGSGMALAGIILGVVGLLLSVVYWVLWATGAIHTRFYVD